MEAEQAVVRLGRKLDEWFKKDFPILASPDDPAGWAEAYRNGLVLVAEFDQLKAESLTALSMVLNQQAFMDDGERMASLVHGFVHGAKLAATLHDEFRDVDGETKVVRLMDAMVSALDGIGSGRRIALEPLLQHPDARVRACAGSRLLALMPERVLPVLRHIEETEDSASAAHLSAYWRRRVWELDGK